jgi:hypothetical protein
VVRLNRASKKGAVFVPDTPADLLDRRGSAFEPAFGVFDTQALHVLNRRKPGGLEEAAFERALGQLGALNHFFHWIADGEVAVQPLLHTGDLGVAVVPFAFEDDVGCEPVLVPLVARVYKST